MKCIKKFMAVALACFCLLLATPTFPFDVSPGTFGEFSDPDKEYVDISTSITRIVTFGTAEGFIPEFVDDRTGKVELVRAVGIFGQEGHGAYIGSTSKGHYFATAAHIIIPAHVYIQNSTLDTYVAAPVKIITQVIHIGSLTALGSVPAEVVYINENIDIALLRVVGYWPGLRDLGYRPVRTYQSVGDLIHDGDAVAMVAAMRDEDGMKLAWSEVRYGKVIHAYPYVPGSAPEYSIAWFSLNDVTTDLLVYPGDSGSPVFAFINGKPVIIGIARATVEYTDPWTRERIYASYFTRIDPLVRFLLEK